MKIFIWVFGGIGAILLVIGAILFLQERSFLAAAETATGTVTDFDLSSDSDNSYSYCPVINFATKSGQKVEYHANVCSAPPAYDVGDHVQVIYDPENPRKVQMDSFWGKYVGPLVLLLVGGPFLLIGLLTPLWATRKK
jgi:hypothetical protein